MKPSTILMVVGALLALGGIIALLNPVAASLAVTTLVGIFFLVGGVVQAWAVFQDEAGIDRVWNGIVALLTIVAGVWLLANPLEGTISLTLILGILFVIMGVARLALASRFQGSPLRWLLLLSGAASILIGILVFTDFASLATSLLGILLGIQLIAEGGGLLAIGAFIRRSTR